MDDENKSPSKTQDQAKEPNLESVAADDKKEKENNPTVLGSHNEVTQEGISGNEVNTVADDLEAMSVAGNVNENKGENKAMNLSYFFFFYEVNYLFSHWSKSYLCHIRLRMPMRLRTETSIYICLSIVHVLVFSAADARGYIM